MIAAPRLQTVKWWQTSVVDDLSREHWPRDAPNHGIFADPSSTSELSPGDQTSHVLKYQTPKNDDSHGHGHCLVVVVVVAGGGGGGGLPTASPASRRSSGVKKGRPSAKVLNKGSTTALSRRTPNAPAGPRAGCSDIKATWAGAKHGE